MEEVSNSFEHKRYTMITVHKSQVELTIHEMIREGQRYFPETVLGVNYPEI
jgi:hypothetical protein